MYWREGWRSSHVRIVCYEAKSVMRPALQLCPAVCLTACNHHVVQISGDLLSLFPGVKTDYRTFKKKKNKLERS